MPRDRNLTDAELQDAERARAQAARDAALLLLEKQAIQEEYRDLAQWQASLMNRLHSRSSSPPLATHTPVTSPPMRKPGSRVSEGVVDIRGLGGGGGAGNVTGPPTVRVAAAAARPHTQGGSSQGGTVESHSVGGDAGTHTPSANSANSTSSGAGGSAGSGSAAESSSIGSRLWGRVRKVVGWGTAPTNSQDSKDSR